MTIEQYQKADRILDEIKKFNDVKNLNEANFIIQGRDARFTRKMLDAFKAIINEEVASLEKKFEEI